ncbi:MAG: hypothetical protein ACJ8HJ_23845 [Massilia sp.]
MSGSGGVCCSESDRRTRQSTVF